MTSLWREVRAEKNRRVYEDARERHPTLTAHPSIQSVLDALADQSRARNAEKDAITRALLVEYQREHLRFWSTVLVLAYTPMIAKLRGRILRDVRRDGPDEAHQIVATAFLEVIAAVPPDEDWICCVLRQETSRRVFKLLGLERKINAVVYTTTPRGLDRAVATAPEGPWLPVSPCACGTQLAPDERDEAEAFLREHAHGVLDEEEVGLVVAATIRGERLAKRASRQQSHRSGREQHREYERIKRRHSRALEKLRAALREWKADACSYGT